MSYRFLVTCILLGGSLTLASCGDDGRNGGRGGNTPDSGGMMSCMADEDCNDMIDCTNDSCAVGGVCRAAIVDVVVIIQKLIPKWKFFCLSILM